MAMNHQMSTIHQVTAPSDNIAVSTDPDNSTRNDDSKTSDSNSSTASTRDTEEINSEIWKTFLDVMRNDYLLYRYSNDFRQYTQVTDPHL
ncbi:hypothetical protein M422DRAFT_264153 [Sphaerobolus stellatus SS14]|uniref:Uncharacterized protein n=1 Tax=Sphaerobolus stellatus (strain SS14) TaxID=990650 RepID=A0A0C9UX44_SPHS4|nr:hypothetical protein M422DRAFT_264153 [Sphaerobolus stellatus SS14]